MGDLEPDSEGVADRNRGLQGRMVRGSRRMEGA